MKRFILFLSLLAGMITGQAQKYQFIPGYGFEYNRVIVDAALGIPMFSTPTLSSNDPTKAYIGFKTGDTTHIWIYNPASGLWNQSSGGSGGGSDTSLQKITDNGKNKTTNSLIVGVRDSVGYVFKYGWNQNPLNTTYATDNTPTATLITNGTNTILGPGGGNNTNNFIDFPAMRFGSENFTVYIPVICKDKSGGSGGIGVGFVNMIGSAMMAHFLLHDTSGYVASTLTIAYPTPADDNNRSIVNFKWNQDDSLMLVIRKRSRSLDYWMYDKNTGSISRLQLDNKLFNSVGNLRLYTYGGTWNLYDSIRVRYDELYSPDILWIGDSWLYGGNASVENKTHYAIATSGFNSVRMSGPGETSLQGTYRFSDIVLMHPRFCVWYYGINDLNTGGAGPNAQLDSFCKRTIRFIVLCQSIGTTPILAEIGPQVTDAAKYIDSIHAIAGRYGNLVVIPTYRTLKHPTQVYMDDKYVTNDPVHMNDNGHDQLGLTERKIMDSLLTPMFPLNLQNLTQAAKPRAFLTINEYGRVSWTIPGGDRNYIINQPVVNNTVNPQIANIWTQGIFWNTGTDFRWSLLGTSIVSAPYVHWDATAQMFSALLTRNLNTISGHAIFDGTAANSTPEIEFINGAFLQPVSQALTVKAKNINTNKNAFVVTTLSGTIAASDTLINVKVNGGGGDSTQMWVDRIGGGHFNWMTGYTHPFDYTTLGNNHFVTRRNLDSIAAVIVGGAGGLTDFIFTNGSGFIGSVTNHTTTPTLALTTNLLGRQLMFASATGGILGTDSIVWRNNQLSIPFVSTVNSQLRVGEIEAQTYASGNSWISNGSYYDGSNFVRRSSGTFGQRIYFLNGDITFDMVGSTGSAGATITFTNAMNIKSTAKIGMAGISAPTAWLHLVGSTTSAASLRMPTGAAPSSPNEGEMWQVSNRFHFYTNTTDNTIAWLSDIVTYTGSNGVTKITNDFRNDLITGKAGGQAITGGTAANDPLLIKANSAAAGNTGTTAGLVFLVGNSGLTTGMSIDHNGSVSTRFLTGTTAISSITAGTGAGTSPTVSVTGTDLGGFITVLTGTSPASSATIGTINFGSTFPSAPRSIMLTPANATTAALSGVTAVVVDQANITTGGFVLASGPTNLTGATTYKWYYHIIL